MKHIVPEKNWHMALVDIIETAQTGDRLVVRDDAQQALAQSAIQRMCPDKAIVVLIEPFEW